MLLEREYPETCTEFATDKFIIWSSGSHVLLIVNNWKVIHAVKDEVAGNDQKSWQAPLPYFDADNFPFIMVSGMKSYNLCNVKTGKLFPMILGTAMNSRF